MGRKAESAGSSYITYESVAGRDGNCGVSTTAYAAREVTKSAVDIGAEPCRVSEISPASLSVLDDQSRTEQVPARLQGEVKPVTGNLHAVVDRLDDRVVGRRSSKPPLRRRR